MISETFPTDETWRPGTRMAFRFALAWFVLIDLPFPLNAFPPLERVTEPLDAMWAAIVSFAGRHLFGLQQIAHETTGSGDRTYDYVLLFCQTAIAVIVTVLWSMFDRRREYKTLHAWLRVYVRFALAAAMLTYGAYKVIPAQFPPNSPFRLSETFGDASPMGLLWAFMGASAAYTIFAGLGEVTGGVLLIFRRTALLGALVSMAVLANIVMLNFSYDVPVKLYSSGLFLHGVFLVIPDLRRILDFFVLHGPTTPLQEPVVIASPAFRRAAPFLATAFMLTLFGFPLDASYKQLRTRLDGGPLYGIWTVEAFSADGASLPPLLTDSLRWRRLTFHGKSIAWVQLMDDTRQPYVATLDERARTLTLAPREKPAQKSVFAYAKPQPGLLTLRGTHANRKVDITLRSKDLSKFLLISRGFHWINEVPFNR
ncbi:MAG TPA: hypothetical protein VLV78_21600 [Thermoanaerobaculia bacterium]|nr:hypothetical protein [Thermoanaerobaculia bacterium]